MRVVWAKGVQARPQFFEREAINTGIYLADRTLLGRRRFFFDDCLHASLGIANDASVVRGIVQFRAEDCGGGFPATMGIKQRCERFGSQQRSVTRHNDDALRCSAHFAASGLQGVTCSALWLL